MGRGWAERFGTSALAGVLAMAGAVGVTATPAVAAGGGGVIQGTVTRNGSAAPAGTMVLLQTHNGHVLDETATTATGGYSFSHLVPGTYDLRFTTPAAFNLMTEWYPNAASADGAAGVTVSEGHTVTADAALDAGGQLVGVVRDSTGAGVGGVTVHARGSDNDSHATTAADGTYRVRKLRTGQVTVSFAGDDHPAQWHPAKSTADAAEPVSVTTGATTTLAPAVLVDGGAFVVQVTDRFGIGIRRACVDIFTTDGRLVGTRSDDEYDESEEDWGVVVGDALVPGDYLVRSSACGGANLADEWYPDAAAMADAQPVTVVARELTNLGPHALPRGGEITGTLRAADRLPPEPTRLPICVTAYLRGSDRPAGFGWADPDGSFTIPALATGSYDVLVGAELDDECDSTTYRPLWLGGGADRSSAVPVAVTAGETRAGVRATLHRTGSLSGRVRTADGEAVQTCVWVYDAAGDLVAEPDTYDDYTPTGLYTAAGLAPGTYRVLTGCGGEPGKWHGDASTLATAAPVVVLDGIDTPDVDVVVDGPTPPPRPFVAIADARVREPAAGTAALVFAVSRTGNLSAPSTVSVSTAAAPSPAATAGADFTSFPTTVVSFVPGERTKTVTVSVKADAVPELPEALVMRLTAPAGGAIVADGSATGTILDSDAGAPALLSVRDAFAVEGDDAILTIVRDGDTSEPVGVVVSTVSVGTATSGADYEPLRQTVRFAAGETTTTFVVRTVEDAVHETDLETLEVTLSSPVRAHVGDPSAVATIADDDGGASLVGHDGSGFAVGDVRVAEPSSGTASAVVTVSRSGGLDRADSVQLTAGGGTASGSDLAPLAGAGQPQLVDFAVGETSKQVTLPLAVKADAIAESVETIVVSLSSHHGSIADPHGVVHIVDEDRGTPATIAVADLAVLEGDSSDQPAMVTVVRAGAVGETSTVVLRTRSATARSATGTASSSFSPATTDEDYEATLVTVTFAPYERVKRVPVVIHVDEDDTVDEHLLVVLSAPTNAAVADDVATLTIEDDDA